jgi:hypothetical protein
MKQLASLYKAVLWGDDCDDDIHYIQEQQSDVIFSDSSLRYSDT